MTESYAVQDRQICFSRLGRQGSGSGWQTFNITPGTDQRAVDAYRLIQNGNAPSAQMNIDSDDQTVTELRIADGYAFMSRLNYGLADPFGRKIVFSHGYVFDLDRFRSDPQIALNLDRSDFSFSEETTASLPDPVVRAPRISFAQAMNMLNLHGEQGKAVYANLIYSVYGAMLDDTGNSLTVICDCTPETIRAVMVAVYAAVPVRMRGGLSFSTFVTNRAAPTTLVFATARRSATDICVDLAQSPQGNDFSESYEDTGVITHIIDELMAVADAGTSSDASPLDGAYQQWDGIIAQLTDLDRADENIRLYDLAFDLQQEETETPHQPTRVDCSRRLNKCLSVPAKQGGVRSPVLDQHIAQVLGQISEYGYPILGNIPNRLLMVLKATSDEDLLALGYACLARDISNDPEDKAMVRIDELAKRDDSFQAVKDGIFRQLAATPAGRVRLARYFVRMCEHLRGGAATSDMALVQRMHAVISRYFDVSDAAAASGDQVTLSLRGELYTLAEATLTVWLSQAKGLTWAQYQQEASQIAASAGFGEQSGEYSRLADLATRAYWKQTPWESFDVKQFVWDDRMNVPDDARCALIHHVASAWQAYQQRNLVLFDSTMKALQWSGPTTQTAQTTDPEAAMKGAVCRNLVDTCMAAIPQGGYASDPRILDFWLSILTRCYGMKSARFLLDTPELTSVVPLLDKWPNAVRTSQIIANDDEVRGILVQSFEQAVHYFDQQIETLEGQIRASKGAMHREDDGAVAQLSRQREQCKQKRVYAITFRRVMEEMTRTRQAAAQTSAAQTLQDVQNGDAGLANLAISTSAATSAPVVQPVVFQPLQQSDSKQSAVQPAASVQPVVSALQTSSMPSAESAYQPVTQVAPPELPTAASAPAAPKAAQPREQLVQPPVVEPTVKKTSHKEEKHKKDEGFFGVIRSVVPIWFGKKH